MLLAREDPVRFSVLNHPDFESALAAGAGGSTLGNVINDGVLLMLASLGLRGLSYRDVIDSVATMGTSARDHNIPADVLTILGNAQMPSHTTHCFEDGKARALQLWAPVRALEVIRAAIRNDSHVTVAAQGKFICQRLHLSQQTVLD